MENIYNSFEIFDNLTNSSLSNLDLYDIMTDSRDYDRLLWSWKGWHDLVGKQIRKNFTRTVEINNRIVKKNGFADLSDYWISNYEDKNFENEFDRLFEEIKPLYKELHAYVRRKLKDNYGSKYPQNLNPNLIPAHLLGDMWTESWENIYSLLVPYPNVQPLNLTKSLIEKNYTVEKMFRTSEEFFTSIGLHNMTPWFWNSSMFVKPEDREVDCRATSYDFSNGYDYRVTMCARINEYYFNLIHARMTDIEYFMSFRNQHALFQSAANSAFYGAIRNAILLSVQSIKHLNKKGLVEKSSMNENETINYLMLQALDKVAYLINGYLFDKWRWNVFRGKINESNYNQKWWEMM